VTVVSMYDDALPDALASYYRRLDCGDLSAAVASFSHDVRYAVPWPDQIETAPRRLVLGRTALADYFATRGVTAHGHEVRTCVVAGDTCLLEGVTRPRVGGDPISTFAATATLDETGLVRRYVAYQCQPAVPPTDTRPAPELAVDARDIVDRYFHALEAGDFEGAVDCFTDDVVYSHPPYRHTGIDSADGRITFRGRAQLLAGFHARGRRSFEHRILTCERRGRHALFDGVVDGLPNGQVGGFLSSMTLDDASRIRRYVSFYCEPAAWVADDTQKDHEELPKIDV
jgi:ketosteroid isomerase-like protein